MVRLASIGLLSLFFLGNVYAAPSSETPVRCGDVVEGEYTNPFEEHSYLLDLAPGDALQVSVVPIGDYLSNDIKINGPSGNNIVTVGKKGKAGPSSAKTKKLSGRGAYEILVRNYSQRGNTSYKGFLGMYTLSISCVLRDGTVIKPLG